MQVLRNMVGAVLASAWSAVTVADTGRTRPESKYPRWRIVAKRVNERTGITHYRAQLQDHNKYDRAFMHRKAEKNRAAFAAHQKAALAREVA